MSTEGWEAIRLVGLPIVQEDGAMVGTVTNASAGEEGKITNLCFRPGWMAGERWLSTSDLALRPDCAVTSRSREHLQSCPAEGEYGLVGIEVDSREGETLGKITNVLAEPGGLNVVGLELSNGLVKDWARGRSLVTLRPDNKLGEVNPGRIILAEEARPISTRDEAAARAAAEPPPGMAAHPVDWDLVRSTPEEEMAAQMAHIVWERRGAPAEREDDTEWLEQTRPWAAALKRAAESGKEDAFNDPALLSSDQIEALRLFRVGLEPIDRGVGAAAPEVAELAGKGS
ncbi:MAG: hypothetical protein LC772_05550 [Chloroflexi bacterium]|nr:hypothetical protein [Chloroflexota bacterium]